MNATSQQRPEYKWHWLRSIGTLLTCVAILGASVVAMVVINRTEPTAKKDDSSRKSAALVETVTVQRGTYSPRLVVLGTVQAAQDIVLSPRVSGQVIYLSPKLVPGGMIRKGDLLLRIDPADFENAVSISQSELAQAQASREIELARQRLAEKELRMLEGSIDNTNRSLVMREPQIASIEAEVSAAQAAVDRAKLDLDRTSVHAPFDAQVLSRSVNVGSQVAPVNELARLIGLEEYWIMAAVPVRSVRWVQFPESNEQEPVERENNEQENNEQESNEQESKSRDTSEHESKEHESDEQESASQSDASTVNGSPQTAGSKVILRNPDVWGPDVERHARVARMIGTLDAQTRLARVLVIVDDPLGQKSDAPPLILDTLIETEIEGRPIEDVVRLQRDLVRVGDTVWVMKDDKLEIRETEIIFRDIQYAYIRKGLDTGDQVVTTTLATVAEGVGLRKNKEAKSDEEFSLDTEDSEEAVE